MESTCKESQKNMFKGKLDKIRLGEENFPAYEL